MLAATERTFEDIIDSAMINYTTERFISEEEIDDLKRHFLIAMGDKLIQEKLVDENLYVSIQTPLQ